MSMIAGGDHKARNAFLTNLRDDSSRRVIDATVPNRTQELDPSDILEVKDLANAIERAERSMVTPLPIPAQYSRGLDMFDALGTSADSSSDFDATDDTSGPALHAPVIPTPIPPAMAAPAPKPSAPILYVQAAEDDAYLQPAPRIRSLAEESLQLRAQPTLLVRAQGRRRKATTIAGIVFGLAALFMGGAFAANALTAQADAAPLPVATTTIATATLAKTSTPAPETKPTEAKPVEAKAEPKPAAAKPAEKPAVPTFDVKSLPPAKGR